MVPTVLGALLVISFAVWGNMLMTYWAPPAASGISLEATLIRIHGGGESWSRLPGLVFMWVGIGLGLWWARTVLSTDRNLSATSALGSWALLVALGSPAYFLASSWNLMSVADTFGDWNRAAAWNLEAPLHLVSAGAAAISVVCAVLLVAKRAVGSGTTAVGPENN